MTVNPFLLSGLHHPHNEGSKPCLAFVTISSKTFVIHDPGLTLLFYVTLFLPVRGEQVN